MNIRNLFLVMLIACGLTRFEASAQNDTSQSVFKQFIIESSYLLEVKAYKVPGPRNVPVPSGNSKKLFNSPESLIDGLHSAIFAGDYLGYLNCWTKESRDLLLEINKKENLTPSFWVERWKNSFSGTTLYIHNRINFGKYVLIEYSLRRGAEEIFRDTMPLVKSESDGWQLTQELRNNPVVSDWRKERVRVPAVVSSSGSIQK